MRLPHLYALFGLKSCAQCGKSVYFYSLNSLEAKGFTYCSEQCMFAHSDLLHRQYLEDVRVKANQILEDAQQDMQRLNSIVARLNQLTL